MKINDVFDTASTEPMGTAEQYVMEAARFGRREAGVVMRNSDQFKIGIEYEFDVTEGASAVEDEIGRIVGTKLESELNKFILSAAGDIEEIVNDFDIDEYPQQAKDAQRGDQEDIDSFFQFYYGDAKQRLLQFRNIMKQSVEVGDVSNIDSDVWKGRGFPSSPYMRRPVRLPELEDADFDTVVANFGTEENVRFFLDALTGELRLLEKYVDKDCRLIVGDTVSEIINGMSNAIKENREKSQASNNQEPTKIDVVKDSLPIPSNLLAGIVADPTVPNGVEVVTKPLDLRQTFDVMKKMFDYVDRVGGTSMSTGLHVNMSIKNFDPKNFNAVKAVVLLDPDSYQTGRKYPMRDQVMLSSLFKVLQREDILAALAKGFIRGGETTLVKKFEQLIEITSDKFRSVNLGHFFDEEATIKSRRIEFRFVGGSDYHTRFNEITNDIGHMCYVMLAGMNEDFLKREYYRGILRLLDRATKTATRGEAERFIDLVDAAKKRL